MDWSKAKSILISLFIILNTFLLAVIFTYYSGTGISRETILNAQSILAQRGVRIDGKIPNVALSLGTLTVKDDRLVELEIIEKFFGPDKVNEKMFIDTNEISKGTKRLSLKDGVLIYENEKPSNDLNFTDKASVEKYVRNYFKDISIPLSQFKVKNTQQEENKTIIKFMQKYDKHWVFDNYIIAIVSKEGLEFLEVSYKKTEGEYFSKEIIPAYMVLLKNFKFQEEEITISSIEIGYKQDDSNLVEQEKKYIPVWRVVVEDEDEIYYSAFTGEPLKSKNVEKYF